MKKAVFAVLILLALSLPAGADEKSEAVADARAALNAFKLQDGTLAPELSRIAGYAVFNTVGKGGFVVGGARGEGVVFTRDTPLGTAVLTQVTVGFQLGGQTFSELILFQSEQALRDFQKSEFSLSAQAAAVAATSGAAATAPYTNGVKILTMVKGGLMFEASVGGQQFQYKSF
jgi:lipid-binding SYLF domain-containing protein